jgi:hypothetical protein
MSAPFWKLVNGGVKYRVLWIRNTRNSIVNFPDYGWPIDLASHACPSVQHSTAQHKRLIKKYFEKEN